MEKHDINILIVEDDNQIGGAVQNALVRAGFKAHHVKNPQDALAYIKIQEIHGLFIDCMLPRMNGVDLAVQLKASMQEPLGIILSSGIFKDRQFINQAIDKTQANLFLKKPFDILEVPNFFDKEFQQRRPQQEFPPLLQALIDEDQKARKKINAINNSDAFHCFDLPLILSMLWDVKATGSLNIKTTDSSIAGIDLFEGKISRIDLKNEKSYIGMLLIEKGFVKEAELAKYISEKTGSVPIGQWLIKMNVISPHAMDIIIDEQSTIRLNKLITDSNMEANFSTSDSIPAITQMSEKAFLENLSAWTSRTRADWLKKFYLPIMTNRLIKGSRNWDDYRVIDLEAFQLENPNNLFTDKSLEKVLEDNSTKEGEVLRLFHFLNITSGIKIDKIQINSQGGTKLNRLKKLNKDLQAQNYFERLGLSRSAKQTDIKKAYHDLAKVLHPDKVPPGSPKEMIEVAQEVFKKVQLAYETLSDSAKREKYLGDLQANQAEKLIQAENLLETARSHILKGAFSQAQEAINESELLNPDSVDLYLTKIWIKVQRQSRATPSQINDWKKQLQSTPPEHRESAIYYHVKGLVFIASDELDKARASFEQALTFNQSFMASKRELSLLDDKKGSGKNTDLLNKDLRDVVGMFFRKK